LPFDSSINSYLCNFVRWDFNQMLCNLGGTL
jgi:hypothetical protein